MGSVRVGCHGLGSRLGIEWGVVGSGGSCGGVENESENEKKRIEIK
jgi:hypothetical protein